jgi:hypothetical protein
MGAALMVAPACPVLFFLGQCCLAQGTVMLGIEAELPAGRSGTAPRPRPRADLLTPGQPVLTGALGAPA